MNTSHQVIRRTIRYSLALSCVLLVSFVQHAHAYLDPATGTLLVQMIFGGIAGAAAAVKLLYARFPGRSGKSGAAPEAAGDTEEKTESAPPSGEDSPPPTHAR